MRRLAAFVAAVAVLSLAAPARALEPAPSIVTFDAFPDDRVEVRLTADSGCFPARVASGGFDGGPYVGVSCVDRGVAGVRQQVALPFTIDVREPVPLVELFVRGTGPTSEDRLIIVACAGLQACDPVDRDALSPAPSNWVPVVLRGTKARPITHVLLVPSLGGVELDDVGLSATTAQPDTEITAGPPALSPTGDAAFTFRANQPGAGFTCTLDGTPLETCDAALRGLADGAHTFTVAAVDRWGLLDATPATYAWTVRRPATAASRDADSDGVADAGDNCATTPNSDQADADRDAVGDACEVLPSGKLPAVAGVRTVVRALSGEVFVKLPARTPADFRSLRVPFQETGFVPLKGIAAVPVGSVVDTRKGRVALTSAANGRPVGDTRRRIQAATFAAGMFRIRQARAARRRASRAIATDAVLVSPPRAARVCVGSTRTRPLKGIVRRLTASGKGLLRAVGGASTGTTRNATFVTTDRCDGTLTEVGRGRVRVASKRHPRRSVTVRAGRAYRVKARLFAVKKG